MRRISNIKATCNTIINPKLDFRNPVLLLLLLLLLCHAQHNCMATEDRVVVVFIKEFQLDQRTQTLQIIHFSINPNYATFPMDHELLGKPINCSQIL